MGIGRREPWERGSFFACLPAIQEIIMYQIYFFAANANQQGKHSLVSPMKARNSLERPGYDSLI